MQHRTRLSRRPAVARICHQSRIPRACPDVRTQKRFLRRRSTSQTSRMDGCRTCELVARRDADGAPPWDMILRTTRGTSCTRTAPRSKAGWCSRHAGTSPPSPTWTARKPASSARSCSAFPALQEELGCTKTYVAQFAEDPPASARALPRHPPSRRSAGRMEGTADLQPARCRGGAVRPRVTHERDRTRGRRSPRYPLTERGAQALSATG